MTKRTPDRDASIDRLMRGALESHALNARTDACLDAGTLAAWADNTLTRRAREEVESHAADCASCQALLAAMTRTAPQTSAPSGRWHLPRVPWLVPLAGAAAAAILWFAVPTRPVTPPVAIPATPPSIGASRTDQPSADALQKDQSVARSKESSAAPTAPPAPASPATSQGTATRRPAAREDSKDASTNSPAAQIDARAAPRDRPPAGSADTAVPQTAPIQPLAETVTVAPPASAAAPAAAAPASSQAGARQAAKSAPFSVNETVQSAAPLLKSEARAEDAATRPTIVSPNPAARWRIEADGAVQHSADGGVTWTLQQTGVSETLTAGSSPSASVCWLVGPRGVVLRSTDGRPWQRIAFPEAIALVAIDAADEQTATVTAADGRRFSTSDGGQSWSQ